MPHAFWPLTTLRLHFLFCPGLMNETFPFIRTMCAMRGIQFSEVDLRWGIQEETRDPQVCTNRSTPLTLCTCTDIANAGLKSSPQRCSIQVVALCLREIMECRPFVIVLLGERYVLPRCPDWVPVKFGVPARQSLFVYRETEVTERELHGLVWWMPREQTYDGAAFLTL